MYAKYTWDYNKTKEEGRERERKREMAYTKRGRDRVNLIKKRENKETKELINVTSFFFPLSFSLFCS